jgi:23S rRNA (uracil1939-C5)-methyltransferase
LTSSDTAPERSAALQAGAELDLLFTDLLANGQGVGRAGGMVVFCFGPLPHERARVRITEVKPRYAVGEMIECLAEAPERAQPFCPVFGACGGCQLQHLAYSAQLEWKRQVVQNSLRRIGGFQNVEVGATVGMNDPRAYRNKMALVVDHRVSPPALGFYRQRSHDVVAIDACPIVRPPLDAALRRLDALRTSVPVIGMLEDARHLVARCADASGEVVLTVTTERPSENAQRLAPTLANDVPNLVGVTNSFGLASANAILGRKHHVLDGKPEIDEAIGGVRYRVSAGSFFQVNVAMVERIFEFLEPFLRRPGAIVDLYCGVGTFALYFAKHGWKVVGIEENAAAVAEASANARLNGIEAEFSIVTGRVERIVGRSPVQKALRKADALFLDPPRKGADEVTLSAIAAARVPTLWYLSCDAATLARDLKFLVAKGYRLNTVQPFDMFPQTGHVETLVRLEYTDLANRHH